MADAVKIKCLRNFSTGKGKTHKRGDVISVSKNEANYLSQIGKAELAKPKPKPAPASKD